MGNEGSGEFNSIGLDSEPANVTGSVPGPKTAPAAKTVDNPDAHGLS